MEEHIKCNICNIMIKANQAIQHVSTFSHTASKSKLEEDLDAIKEELYNNDSSVIIRWQRSI
jgi:hypothetical protein